MSNDVDRLVRENLRLVLKIANTVHSPTLTFNDFVAAGNEGLFHAARHYDPERNPKFSVYASIVIYGFMMNAIRAEWGGISTNARRRLFFGLRRADIWGVTDPEILSKKLNVPLDIVIQDYGHLLYGHVRLDGPVDGLEREDTVRDLLLNTSHDAESAIDDSRELERIRSAAKLLPDRMRSIIERHYLAKEPESMTDIAREWGLSRQRIQQLEVRAVKELRRIVCGEEPSEKDRAYQKTGRYSKKEAA